VEHTQQHLNILPRSHVLRLWLLWFLAHAVIGALASLISFAVVSVSDPSAATIEGWLFRVPVVVALAGGISLGFAQWLILRRLLPDLEAGYWVRVTALAWLFAGFILFCQFLSLGVDKYGTIGQPADEQLLDILAHSATTALVGILLGGILGVVVGAAQWLVLESYFRRVARWVLLNILAYAAAGYTSSLVVVLLDAFQYEGMDGVNHPAEYAPMGGPAVAIGQGVFFLVAGLLTGAGLLWISRQPRAHLGSYPPGAEQGDSSRRKVLS
jgi:hypothetical protein